VHPKKRQKRFEIKLYKLCDWGNTDDRTIYLEKQCASAAADVWVHGKVLQLTRKVEGV